MFFPRAQSLNFGFLPPMPTLAAARAIFCPVPPGAIPGMGVLTLPVTQTHDPSVSLPETHPKPLQPFHPTV